MKKKTGFELEKIKDDYDNGVHIDITKLNSYLALTAVQQRFVDEYCLIPNISRAYKIAYKSEFGVNGVSTFRLPSVQKAIKEINELNRIKYNITREFIVDKLINIIDTEKSLIQLKALDLLSKIMGIQHQKIEVTGIEPIQIAIVLNDPSKVLSNK